MNTGSWREGNGRRTALFSLNDTSGADRFAERLIKAGWQIIATSESVALLGDKGLPVRDIADFTGVREDYGFPPTLHAKVEYALTAEGSTRIDLVYVIPYPLSKGNDIGGRTLLALAVKGGRIAVMSISDMERVVAEISETGEVSRELSHQLAEKACFEIALHYAALAAEGGNYDMLAGRFSYELLNGENPYQVPASAFVSTGDDDPLSLLSFKKVSGDSPCFTNMADADCILTTMCMASEAFVLNTGQMPYICIAAKHGNACGMGISTASPAEATDKALFGNPRSVWGGEVITNFPVDGKLAEALAHSGRRESLIGSGHWMLDLVMAPFFNTAAIEILGKRKARKLLENSVLRSPSLKESGFSVRMVRGGFLRQPPANYIMNLRTCRISSRAFSENEIASIIIAWAVSFSSNHGGNEVALAKDGALIGAGGGPSTIEAAKVAVARASECGHDTKGAVFGADAFFPFTDTPSVLCDAGVTSGCVPGGGRNEVSVENFFTERGVTVAFIPQEFRGFCRH